MKFTKMEGCGNDYIYVDGSSEHIPAADKPELVRRLSDRHFGIGGDGVIFINPSDEADFEMEMYNADGSRGEMCGNGVRCVAKFIRDKGLSEKDRLSIISMGRIVHVEILPDGGQDTEDNPAGGSAVSSSPDMTMVRVDMGEPVLTPALIPVTIEDGLSRSENGDRVIDHPIVLPGGDSTAEPDGTSGDSGFRITCVSMGNPHAVVFLDDATDLGSFDLGHIGPKFEHHSFFPKRTNTEFVHVDDRANVHMRVWERGTGETLACGTGCCATAVASILNGHTDRRVTVHVRGGDIVIEWDEVTNHVFMTGPAVTVFEGEVQ